MLFRSPAAKSRMAAAAINQYFNLDRFMVLFLLKQRPKRRPTSVSGLGSAPHAAGLFAKGYDFLSRFSELSFPKSAGKSKIFKGRFPAFAPTGQKALPNRECSVRQRTMEQPQTAKSLNKPPQVRPSLRRNSSFRTRQRVSRFGRLIEAHRPCASV